MHQTPRVTLAKESLPHCCMSAMRNCKRHQLPLETPEHGTRNKSRKWHLGFRASHLPHGFSCGREKVTYRFAPNSHFLGIFQSLGKNLQPVGTSISNHGVRPLEANPKPAASGPGNGGAVLGIISIFESRAATAGTDTNTHTDFKT